MANNPMHSAGGRCKPDKLTRMQAAPTFEQSPEEVAILAEFAANGDLDQIIPQLASNQQAIRRIESAVRHRKTSHDLILGDARAASELDENSIHLVVTSPPYWTLKRYNEHSEQLGHVSDYDQFI